MLASLKSIGKNYYAYLVIGEMSLYEDMCWGVTPLNGSYMVTFRTTRSMLSFVIAIS